MTMGSFPSRVRNSQLPFRRRVAIRIHPAAPAPPGSEAPQPHHASITINVESASLDNGFVVQNSYGGSNALQRQRQAFAHASNQSLEAMFTANYHQDPETIVNVLSHCWELVESTCLPEDECREMWSSCSGAHMRSNGWITVRLFVCASLQDFPAEREFLHEVVFRELQNWCEDDRIHLVVTDLYASLETERRSPEFLRLCMEEIDRCTEDGVPILFLGMLSETVGWIPEKHEVPKSLAEQYGWIHGLSLMEMMCIHAVYRSRSPNALFLARERNYLESLPEGAHQQPAEAGGNSHMDAFKHKILQRFPEQVQSYKCSASLSSSAASTQPSSSSMAVDTGGLDACRRYIMSVFQERIRKQFPNVEGPVCKLPEQYRKHQDGELARTVASYQNCAYILPQLKAVERQIQVYINQGGSSPLLVSSVYPGSGKTGILSRSVHQLLKNGGHPYQIYGQRSSFVPVTSPAIQSGKSWAVFYHFAGSQPRSTELVVLLQRIWNIAELQPHRLNPMPSDLNQLALQVRELLSRPPAKRLTIFINHLDQIEDAGSNYLQKWLPRRLPENLRLIITCGQREKKNKCWKVLKVQYPSAVSAQLEMPRKQECLEMVQSELPARLCFRLGTTKLNEFIEMMEDSTPMAIVEACRQLTKYYNEADGVSMLELEDKMESLVHYDLVGMLTDGLVQVEATPGFPKVLVAATMCLLHCSRAGLLESELLKMLGAVCTGDKSRLAVSKAKFASEGDVTRLAATAEESATLLETSVESPAALPANHESSAEDMMKNSPTGGESPDQKQSLQSVVNQSPANLSAYNSKDENIDEDFSLLPGAAAHRHASFDNGRVEAYLNSIPTQRRQSVPAHMASALMGGKEFVSLQSNLHADQDRGGTLPLSMPASRKSSIPSSAKAPGLVKSNWQGDSATERRSAAPYHSRFQRKPDDSSTGGSLRKRDFRMSRSRLSKRTLFQGDPPPPPPDLDALLWAQLIRCLQPWIRRVGDKTDARWALSHTIYHDVVKAYYFSRSPSGQEFPFHLNSPEFYNAANSHFGKSQQTQVTTLAQRRASQFNLHLAHEREPPTTAAAAAAAAAEEEEEATGEYDTDRPAEVHRVTFAVQHTNHEQLARQRYGWWHERLAGFFEETDDEDRRAEELPIHLEATCNETQLRRCLSRWQTFVRLFNTHSLGGLLHCWKQAGGARAAVVEYRRELDHQQVTSTVAEMVLKRTKCAQLLCAMGGLEEAQLMLEVALKLSSSDTAPTAATMPNSVREDQANIHLCLARVFNDMVLRTDLRHEAMEASFRATVEQQQDLQQQEQESQSGRTDHVHAHRERTLQPQQEQALDTPGDSHLDANTTHPLAVCPPEDAMTGLSSELQSNYMYERTSLHPPPQNQEQAVDTEWLQFHEQLRTTVQATVCATSKRVLQEAQLAIDLHLAVLPPLPVNTTHRNHRRQGSDAGISSTTSSRKSSIIASRDSLAVPVLQPRRSSSTHERRTSGDNAGAAGTSDKDRRCLQQLAQAATLACKHGQLLLHTDAASSPEERQSWVALCQRAAIQCIDIYEKLGDTLQQAAALINLASTYSSSTAVPVCTPADQAARDAEAGCDSEGHMNSNRLLAAKVHLEEALVLILKHIGQFHDVAAQAHHHLALISECLGEKVTASYHYRQWLLVTVHLYGPNHPITKSTQLQCRRMDGIARK